MHLPPAARCKLGRSRWQLACIGILVLVQLGLLGTLAARGLMPVMWVSAMLVLTWVLAAFALVQWWRSPSGLLRWDGAHWNCSLFPEADPCHVAVSMDFQVLMVLSVRAQWGARMPRYLWIEGSMVDPHWRAMRRAVFGAKETRSIQDPTANRPQGSALP